MESVTTLRGRPATPASTAARKREAVIWVLIQILGVLGITIHTKAKRSFINENRGFFI
jgi:hypothetical protein